ncbi:hypothetical protein O1611_g5444 [Lasiodiplodia mahajangana]|uniref:Uncharacterized protein n=1 Tax=Lasiodiplodia mahajangana TaxID=1108764 RepID=A0ACC2JLG0_9PEZI|nr:hypothetical protein O1611_g5444 [Lasiodiplodia mahajangana]
MPQKQRTPGTSRSSSKAPTLPEPPRESRPNKGKWETRKLEHDLDLHAIPYNERLSPLLPRYIPTLAALGDAASSSAFVAFDTESVPHCYKTADVGLAFLPVLSPIGSTGEIHPTLENFAKCHGVSAASFKVNGRYHNNRNRRPKEYLRFTTDNLVDIEDLETALTDQIEKYQGLVPGKELVLVGLSLQNDFERLSLEFPSIIGLFSGWIDLCTLIKAESRYPTKVDTGLGTALTMFQYPSKDTGFQRRHHAANDAVRTLAVLCGLRDPENVANIVLRQNRFRGIEIRTNVQHFESKLYRALLHANGKNLPSLIDSAHKLAFAFRRFNPTGVAADRSNTHNKNPHPPTINASHRTYGCVCFSNKKDLQDFLDATNGQKYGEVVIEAVRAPLPQRIQTQILKGERLKTRRNNHRRKRPEALDIDWGDSFHNTFSIENPRAPDIDWSDSFRNIFSVENEYEERAAEKPSS